MRVRQILTVTLVTLALPLLVGETAVSAKVVDPIREVARVEGVDIAVGNDGYVVVAWTRGLNGSGNNGKFAVITRVKRPGDSKLRPQRTLGSASTGHVNVEVGNNGLTIARIFR